MGNESALHVPPLGDFFLSGYQSSNLLVSTLPLYTEHMSLYTRPPLLFTSVLTVVSLLCFTTVTTAQNASEVTISKIDPQLVTAPAISYSGSPTKVVTPKKWAEIETTFTWQPANPTEKYTDELTVNYYVLLNNKSTQYPQGALLTGQTALASVPAKSLDSGNAQLRTVIYICPRTLERFFGGKAPTDINSAFTDIGVTFSKQGQVIFQKSLKSASGAWWPQFQQTPGLLLNKADTPFAPLNWDYYEGVKRP
jgi:hypothetical protein